MTMKKFLIATAVAASVVAPQAFAQTKNFEGFSAGANVNFAKTRTEANFGGRTFQTDDTKTNGSLQGSYGFALNPKFILGVGATAGIGDLDAGSFNGVSVKSKDMYSLYLEPGYLVNDTTLLYGKVAYQSMKGELSGAGVRASDTFDGYGFGVGVRKMINKNVYLQAEISEINYSSQSFNGVSMDPKQTVGTIGVGYKF
jgi:opacity protein-like surface antigen